MREIGKISPGFRVPALVEGQFTYLDSKRYVGRWQALCFLPYPSLLDPACLDGQATLFEQLDTTLLIVNSGTRPLPLLWINCPVKPRTPVLADPLGRLHRFYGVTVAQMPARCHTFLVDRAGTLRLHLIHDFTDHGLSAVQEMVTLSQAQDTGSVAARNTIADRREETPNAASHLVSLRPSSTEG